MARNTSCTAVLLAMRLSILMIVSLLCTSYSVYAETQISAAERLLFDALNRERAAQGLAELRWDNALAAAARQHAVLMARSNTLSHQLPGEPSLQERALRARARFSLIAENIAEAPSPANIHAAWMQSPPHRGNILDPQLNAVGIAVVQEDRQLFAVQDFSHVVDSLNLDQQEQQVASLLAARGLQVAPASDARKTCDMDRGFLGSPPTSVVRFQTADLRRLPDDLERRLQQGRYRAATVGACPVNDATGSAGFRIAVLLY
jgi:hypothetical protein